MDLQIAKASGLLTFIGIVTAVALLLVPTRDAPSGVPTILFVSLSVSGLLSLFAVFALWNKPDQYRTASKVLAANLKLAAWRGLAGNIGTVGGAVSAIALAVWVACGEPVAQQTLLLVPPGQRSLPVELADTVRLRCSANLSAAARSRPVDVECLVQQ